MQCADETVCIGPIVAVDNRLALRICVQMYVLIKLIEFYRKTQTKITKKNVLPLKCKT